MGLAGQLVWAITQRNPALKTKKKKIHETPTSKKVNAKETWEKVLQKHPEQYFTQRS